MKQKVKCNDKSLSQIQKDIFKLEKTAKPLKIESGHASKIQLSFALLTGNHKKIRKSRFYTKI